MNKIIDYRIVIPEHPSTNEQRAASFIRENVKLVCGKKLDIVKDTEEPAALEIVVGKTNRESLDGVNLERSRTGIWEFMIFKKGDRLYVTGMGTPPEVEPEYTSAYRKLDDGSQGTAMAAYRFVDDILGYQFVYSAYEEFPEDPDLSMPEEYEYNFTREHLRLQRPKAIDGAALYSINASERIDWNIGSFIIKTREGKIIVIDGGHTEELPRLLECIKSLSNDEIPTVSAWLFSHLHGDHYGAYMRLARDESFGKQIRVEDMYCNFLSREFVTDISPGANKEFGDVYDTFMNSDKSLGARVHIVKKGEVIKVDEIEFEVIHVPEAEYADKMNVNDSSVVYKMTYDKGQTIMFLGDAEWVCNKDLTENCKEKLKSDIVQVGHHGCGNVSRECYELIGADAYIWQCGERFWYQEVGEGHNTHNIGFIRYRAFMKERGIKNENIYVSIGDIDSIPLPMKIF